MLIHVLQLIIALPPTQPTPPSDEATGGLTTTALGPETPVHQHVVTFFHNLSLTFPL